MYLHSGVIITNQGSIESFKEGGGIIFGIFVVYIVIVGVAWYKGSSKREFMKREAVEAELRREREVDMESMFRTNIHRMCLIFVDVD
jgi:hypothetical protein